MRSNRRIQRRQEWRWLKFVGCTAEAVAQTGWQAEQTMDIAVLYDGENSEEEA